MASRFRSIMAEIACDMRESDVKNLLFLAADKDHGLHSDSCRNAHELFEQLEQRRHITPEDPAFLKLLLDKIGRRDLSEKIPGTVNASPAALEVSKMRCSLFTIMIGLLVTEVEQLKYFFKVPQGSKIEDGIDLAWYLLRSDNLGGLYTGLKSISRQDLAKIVETEKQKIGRSIIAQEKLKSHEKLCQKHQEHTFFEPAGKFDIPTRNLLEWSWKHSDVCYYLLAIYEVILTIPVRRKIYQTGFVTKVEPNTGSYTFKKCRKNQSQRSWIFHIATTPVVTDHWELETLRVTFVYDDPQSKAGDSTKTLTVIYRNDGVDESGRHVFTCVCHDGDLAAMLMYQLHQKEKLEKELTDLVVSNTPEISKHLVEKAFNTLPLNELSEVWDIQCNRT